MWTADPRRPCRTRDRPRAHRRECRRRSGHRWHGEQHRAHARRWRGHSQQMARQHCGDLDADRARDRFRDRRARVDRHRATGRSATRPMLKWSSVVLRPARQDRVKVQGRVIASDRTQGVTIIWINPEAIASRPPIAPACLGAEALAKAAGTAASSAVTHDQKVVALIAPMLEPKEAISGTREPSRYPILPCRLASRRGQFRRSGVRCRRHRGRHHRWR